MAGSFTVILSGSALLTNQKSVRAKSQVSTKIEKLLAPHKASYGYYVDQYLLNRKENDSPATNPFPALFNDKGSGHLGGKLIIHLKYKGRHVAYTKHGVELVK